jgi:hypothetical protein
MIPTLPTFMSPSEEDRFAFEAYTAPFPPYSEYNFTGLWCWNTRDNVALSSLGENLVLRFQDFFHSGLFFSFIGRQDIPRTIEMLLLATEGLGMPPVLRFVPESIGVTADLCALYSCELDRDSFDYVYSVGHWLA